MKERFILQEDPLRSGWLLCVDKTHNILCKFEAHKFNETQEVVLLDGDQLKSGEDATAYATYMREMGDWLADNHSDKMF